MYKVRMTFKKKKMLSNCLFETKEDAYSFICENVEKQYMQYASQAGLSDSKIEEITPLTKYKATFRACLIFIKPVTIEYEIVDNLLL